MDIEQRKEFLKKIGYEPGGQPRLEEKHPIIVCLCGSTKFIKEYDEQMLRLTLQGCVVLTVGTHNKDLARKYADNFEDKKEMLDELHKRKIDLCDFIYVLNINGYIGESTKSEIEYAMHEGKDIFYMEPVEE